ncbi:MAG: hypothetical protein GF313_13220 [Caldithrix sp.]|nr:hypothetical protein [Caldithrix sp.]
MKIMTCFIDQTAWLAIIDTGNPNHHKAYEYFEELLSKNTKLVTNNIVIDTTVNELKKTKGMKQANQFLTIIDESIMTINLRMDWVSRRVRRNALNQFFKKNHELELDHFYIYESVKRKKVDVIFSFDHNLKTFGLPLMPLETS